MKHSIRSLPILSLVVAPAFAARLAAQDTRAVTEPTRPMTCTVVPATLARRDSTLAEADESRLDTQRIQRAIEQCARQSRGKKRAVVLLARGAANAFVSGPLELRSGVTLVVDSGVTLFASRDPRVYDVTRGACGVVAKSGRGCRPLISGTDVEGAGVMGPGTIDGRGWAKLAGRDSSWWDLAEEARKGGAQNNPRLVQVTRGHDFTLYDVTVRNGPMFHVYFNGDGFTAWGVTINTPKSARNTDGIDPAAARNVTIAHSFISTGDDMIAIKAGAGPTSNVTVAHNHFYTGHGMSIGSETNAGVSGVLVTDLTIDGADDGLRIKSDASRGGPVTNVAYEDVCIRNTKEPIVLDTHYSKTADGSQVPVFGGIRFRNVRVQGPGRVTIGGYDVDRPVTAAFDGVTFDAPERIKVQASHARVIVGAGGFNLPLAGENVTVTGAGTTATPATPAASAVSCDAKFVPLPTR